MALLAAGCGGDVGAQAPLLPHNSSPTATPAIYPTSTPWPRFGPPPVTAADVTATVQGAPGDPAESVGPGVMPVPSPATTANAGPVDDEIDAGTPVSRPTPSATAPPLDSSGTFEPVLPYEYIVPHDWHAVTGDDEIVLEHSSGMARVILREVVVDRLYFRSLAELAQIREPGRFIGWSERSVSASQHFDKTRATYLYSGTRVGRPYLATVDWRLRGELLVEVMTEADASLWAADSNVRNSAALAASSFAPLPETVLATPVEVEDQLRALFSHRPGDFFLPHQPGTPGSELSCRQVFLDHLSDPVYAGSGVWQVFAVSSHGAQVWEIFEPGLSIVPAPHNTSSC